jgi:hypothetical protein
MAKKKARKSNDILIRLTRREREALEAKSGGNAKKFAKGVVVRSLMKELKDGGRPGNRTHPTESAPTAADKTAAPPGRGQPSEQNENGVEEDRFAQILDKWDKRIIPAASHRFETLLEIVNNESARDSAIVGVAMLDDMLLTTLLTFMGARCTKKLSDCREQVYNLLTDRNPPLGSLYSRSLACFLLGLIDENTRQILDLLRILRNEAAHLAKDFEFDSILMDRVFALLGSNAKMAAAYVWGRPNDDTRPSGVVFAEWLLKVTLAEKLDSEVPPYYDERKANLTPKGIFCAACLSIYTKLMHVMDDHDAVRDGKAIDMFDSRATVVFGPRQQLSPPIDKR